MTDMLPVLAGYVRDMVEPFNHVEACREWVVTVSAATGGKIANDRAWLHRSHHPSLLVSLRRASVDQPQTEAQAATGPARTVPHINLDAVDRMVQIRRGAREWCASFNLDPGAEIVVRLNGMAHDLAELFPRYMRPIEVIRTVDQLSRLAHRIPTMAEFDVRAMVGAAAGMANVAAGRDQVTVSDMAVDVARWRAWCRIFAGWETPPWRPNARCPALTIRDGVQVVCDALPGVVDDRPAGLRVRLEARAAVCLTCNATWGDPPLPSINILAEWCRKAELDARAMAAAVAATIHTPAAGPANRGGRS